MHKIKHVTKAKNNSSDDYGDKQLNIRINSNDDLPFEICLIK